MPNTSLLRLRKRPATSLLRLRQRPATSLLRLRQRRRSVQVSTSQYKCPMPI
ncbi:MAG: hypothetical protein ACYTXA_02845 [Nostoc sp.]